MIYSEIYYINGRSFTRTWSDTGYVKRDGAIYEEANDPTELGRVYEEAEGPEEEVIDDVDTDTDESKTASGILNERIRLAARYASV